jgi:hypothetical protein
MALASAQGVVRALTAQHLTAVSADEQVLDWDGGASVFLPELPVTAVATVEGHDPNADDPTAWVSWPATWAFSRQTGELQLIVPAWQGWWWGSTAAWWPGCGPELQALRVTYDHGYEPLPPELVGVVYGIASRGLLTAAVGGQPVKGETLGQYAYTLGEVSTGLGGWAAGLTAAEAAIIARYSIPNLT